MGEFPNKGTQFSSTNQPRIPGGVNKKGTKHLSTWIQEMMEDENFELKLKDGTIFRGAPIKAVIKTAIAKAMSGDQRAFDMLGKYGWGSKQIHEFQNNPIDEILDKYGLNNDPKIEKQPNEAPTEQPTDKVNSPAREETEQNDAKEVT